MTYGTRAVMGLACAHDTCTRRLLVPQHTGCHLLSEASAMRACGLGSLAGSFPIVFTAGCAYVLLFSPRGEPFHQMDQ